MNKFEYGMKSAIKEIVAGVVTSVLVDSFIAYGFLPSIYLFLFGLLNTIGAITLIITMPLWGLTYLLGWIFGVIIMIQSGLVGIGEIILYLVVPIIVMIIKIKSLFE